MEAVDYMVAWGIYIVFVVIACGLVWYMTRNMDNVEMRKILRVCTVGFLITPYYSDPEQHYLAPAFIVCVFDVMNDGIAAITTAGLPIILVMFCAVLLSMLISVIYR